MRRKMTTAFDAALQEGRHLLEPEAYALLEA
jgi:hypothetical protein